MPVLFKLNAAQKPGDTIRKFSTLIWTERYQKEGDFTLVIEDDISQLTGLPPGTLISHTDTNEVMIVENQEIKRDKQKKLLLTITGRSLETFAENRPTLGTQLPLYDQTTEEAIIETTSVLPAENVARDLLRYCLESPYASSDNSIPNLTVKLAIREPDAPLSHAIKRGDVYSQVLELLGISNAGIKCVRPNGAQLTLDLVIHDGLDRRATVSFDSLNEDLEDPTYFWSIKDYKNFAQVSTHFDARLYRHRNLTGTVVGLNRRIMYLEADDLEGDYTPGTATDVLAGRAQGALDEHKYIVLLSATVSETAKPKFKIHYDVGDIVTAAGEFTKAQPMRVTEHILTVDDTGVRGYPSLALLQE